jgi:hypothetical protein
MNIDKKFRREAPTETRQSLGVYFDREDKHLAYLDQNRDEHVIAEKEGTVNLEVGTDAGSSLVKTSTTYNFGGVEYDTYRLRSWAFFNTANTVQIAELGYIYISNGDMFIIKNSSNIEAVDFNGVVGGYTNTPITPGALVDDATNVARKVDTIYLNQDNTVGSFPQNYNFMYIVGYDAAAFECDVYIDVEFIVEKGETVEFVVS